LADISTDCQAVQTNRDSTVKKHIFGFSAFQEFREHRFRPKCWWHRRWKLFCNV